MAETITTLPNNQLPLLGQNVFKRLFDIIASLFGLLLLAPIFLWLAWLIQHESPGPVFYRGPRVGRGGKEFGILKFRTMREEAASYAGPRVTAQDDPRITPLGKWLRDTKLNELPQLWNVLKGDMSLVGPRPEDPEIARDWPPEVAMEVLSVRPGITSPASVLFRDEEQQLHGSDLMQTYLGEILPSKLRLDQLYVRHRSFWTDLDIIFYTMLVLLPRLGKAPDEVRMMRGPFMQLMQRHVRWFMVDLAVTAIAMGLSAIAWRAQTPLDRGWQMMLLTTIGFAILFSITNVLTGANRITWSTAEASDVNDLVPGAVLATAIAIITNNLLSTTAQRGHFLPDGLLLMAAALSFLGFMVTRYRSRLLTGLATRWLAWRGTTSLARERVLIIGSGETGQYAAWKLGHGYYADTFEIVGYVDDDLDKQGNRIRGLNVLGRSTEIPAIVEKKDIGLIVFAIHNIARSERKRLLDLCQRTEAQVVLWPDVAAALHSLTVHARIGQQKVKTRGDALPCELCLVKFSPMHIEEWLKTMDESLQSGDLPKLQKQIQAFRDIVQPDATMQRKAND